MGGKHRSEGEDSDSDLPRLPDGTISDTPIELEDGTLIADPIADLDIWAPEIDGSPPPSE